MNVSKIFIWIYLFIVLSVMTGCGNSSSRNSSSNERYPCVELCKKATNLILNNNPDIKKVDCDNAAWKEPKTCDGCIFVMVKLYDLEPPDKVSFCAQYFTAI